MTELTPLLANRALTCRGGFHPRPEDNVPELSTGARPGTLVLVGNVGPAMWQTFTSSPEYLDHRADPLDRWTRRILDELISDTADFGLIEPLYPFGGPPFMPFQKWAQRAEPVHPSPTGPLIHPEYGLWHAYRGALAFEQRLEIPAITPSPSPCADCPDQPCLSTCPVDAFDGRTYDVPACVGFMTETTGGESCRLQGCQARRACPVGQAFAYEPAQAEFHTSAFLQAQQPGKHHE